MNARDYHAVLNPATDNIPLLYFEEQRPTEEAVPLQPQKQDTGLNPNERRSEYGDYFAQDDFSGGANQELFHAPGSEPNRYLRSEGLDILKRGQTMFVPKLTRLGTPGVDSMKKMIHAGSIYYITGGDANIYSTTVPPPVGAPQAMPAAPTDLAAAGKVAYATVSDTAIPLYKTDGTNAFPFGSYVVGGSNVTLTTAGSALACQGHLCSWLMQRLIVIGLVASTGQHAFFEVTGAVSGVTSIDIYPLGYEATAIWEANGYIYVALIALNSGRGIIAHYGLNAAGSAIERKGQTEMPAGELPYSGCGYLGKVFIGVGPRPAVYELEPDESGFLNFTRRIVEEKSILDANYAPRFILPLGDYIMFPWSLSSAAEFGPREGVAVYNLVRDAFSFDRYRLRSGGDPAIHRFVSGVRVSGVLHLALTGSGSGFGISGPYRDDVNGDVAPSARLVTSIGKFNSSSLKMWDQIEVTWPGIGAGNSGGTAIDVYYSTKHPDDDSWTLAGTVTAAEVGDGGQKTFALSGVVSAGLALKFEFVHGFATGVAPRLSGYSVRSLPTVTQGTAQWHIRRFIRLLHPDRKAPGTAEIREDPKARRNSLMNLLYQPVVLEEPDATWTGRLERLGDMKPGDPDFETQQGEKLKNGYILEMEIVGTKTA